MTQERVVVVGKVLPGPTMAPPYASRIRCVVWAAGDSKATNASASGALAFRLMLDDGGEVIVEPVGAVAALPIRSTLVYQRAVTEHSETRLTFGQRKTHQQRLKRESRAVAWLAVGDTVSVRGRLVGSTRPFGDNQILVADHVLVDGGKLRVGSLAEGEPEP
jgi:hypothetical protein